MEKIYSYVDIIILAIICIFLLFKFRSVLNKDVGYKKETPSYAAEKVEGATKSSEVKTSNISKYAEGSLNYKIEKIAALEPNFSEKWFIKKSEKAFSFILTKYYGKRLDEIKDFVTEDVYNAFLSNVDNFEAKEIKVEEFLITNIQDITITDNTANIFIKFVTKQNLDSKVDQKREIWVFTKVLGQDSNIWKLKSIKNA